MKRLLISAATLVAWVVVWVLLAPSMPGQVQRVPDTEKTPAPTRLPNGKLQQDEILKEDHERSVKDAAQLIELSESLKQDLEKDDTHVLSLSSLKKTEEIEKIAKRIRTRLKKF